MIQRDYILRMIEEFCRALEALIALKEGRRWQEVAGTLDEQFNQLVGAGASMAVELSETDLLARLLHGEGTQFIREKQLFLIALFKEAGDAAVAQDRADEGRTFYLKGLHLLLGTWTGMEASEYPEFVPRVDVFVSALRDLPLPIRTLALLTQYYERTGSFAKAEDAFFALLDVEPSNDGLIEFGIAFYERLQNQSNDALVAGDLPRPEVEAGLGELRDRKAALPST
jgi:hypothetical protein